jgi:Domain of unknown function (DUF4276)
MSKHLKIAILAEDETDCETIREIIHRLLGANVKTKFWASKGCPTLKRKLAAKLNEMSKQGCNAFVIVHDLDRNPQNGCLNDEPKLRKTLEELASKSQSQNRHICIPIEELEAWFWSDPEVLKLVGRGKGKAQANPDQIKKPKEKLEKLSDGENMRPRYSTNENFELAKKLNFDLCSDRCPSFKDLQDFLKSL